MSDNTHTVCDNSYIDCVRNIVKWYTKEISLMNSNDFYSEVADISKLEVNPYWHKVENGIAIEFYYGLPLYLWTKYGRVRLIGSCTHYNLIGINMIQDLTSRLIEKFSCTLLYPLEKRHDGDFGPVYQIGNVNGMNVDNVSGHVTRIDYQINKAILHKVSSG